MHEACEDLRHINTMEQLHRFAVKEWEHAGGKRKDGLMMEFTDEDGDWVTVTRSVTLQSIKHAKQIRLSLKRKLKRSGSNQYDRVQQDEHPHVQSYGRKSSSDTPCSASERAGGANRQRCAQTNTKGSQIPKRQERKL